MGEERKMALNNSLKYSCVCPQDGLTQGGVTEDQWEWGAGRWLVSIHPCVQHILSESPTQRKILWWALHDE